VRRFRVKVNDQVFEVEVEEVERNEAKREEKPSQSAPVPAAAPLNLPKPSPKVIAPVAKAPEKAPPVGVSGDGQGAILAPIPGVVSQVKVSAGTNVKKGQVLLYLEAMKMQNEILAPYDAVVKEVAVTQGASVQTGDLLVKLDR